MDWNKNVIEPTLGRVGTSIGAAGGVVVADHNAVIQGALVALAGVAIDLLIRWMRNRVGGL